MSTAISQKTKNSLGWVLFSVAVVFLLWTSFGLHFCVRKYGFVYGVMQDVLFPAVSFLILSLLGTLFLRSFLILGFSLCLSSSCLFLVIMSGFVYARSDFPMKLYLDALPFIILQILLNILGAFFLRLANYLEWKWWLKAFLPGTIFTMLVGSLSFIPNLICIIILTWIWYIAVLQLHDNRSRFSLALSKLTEPVISMVFVFNFFVSVKMYFDLNRVKSAFLTGDENIAVAFAPQLRWTRASIILSVFSLIILFYLKKRTISKCG